MNKLVLALPLKNVAFWDRLIEEFRLRGFSVEVWTEITEDEYRKRKGPICELWKRLRIWVIFPVRIVYNGITFTKNEHAILLAPTTPFYLPALVSSVLRFTDISVINLLYDLYPDQLHLANKTKHDSYLSKILAMITQFALRHCDATVFLGDRLKKQAELRYGKARISAVIEVGGDGKLFPVNVTPTNGNLRMLYSGNLGYSHDYETLVTLLKNPLPHGLEIIFHASGVGYEKFKKELDKNGCSKYAVLDGPLRTDEWVTEMSKSQIALVTMRSGAEDILFPSKTYSAMLAGQAILAICPKYSDLASTVINSGAGWVVEPSDANELLKLLTKISQDRDQVFDCRKKAQSYARKYYDMSSIVNKWELLFKELCRKSE